MIDVTSKEALRKHLATIALFQVGIKEVGGNNVGEKVIEYQKSSWLDPGPWSWCAAFCCWVLREWLRDAFVLQHLNLRYWRSTEYPYKPISQQAEAWRCKDSRAFGWEEWARNKGLTVLPETAHALIGDIVIYDFSHIGVVVKNQTWYERYIVAVEGNTNGAGNRESEHGDGVWQKNRHRSLVKSYVRIIT